MNRACLASREPPPTCARSWSRVRRECGASAGARVRESGAFGVGTGPRRQCQVQTGCGCRLGHVPPGRILVIGTREDLTIVPETRDLLRSKTNEVGSDVLTAPVGVPSARACAGAVRTPRPTSQPKLKVRPDYFDAG